MKPDTFEKVIEAIEDGQTLKAAIKEAQTSWRALSLHIAASDEAASRYAHARTVSAAFWADKAVEASEKAYDRNSAAVAKVQAEVYKWRAKVANPREYGDRVDVQAEVRHTVTGVIALPPEEEVPLPSNESRVRASIASTVDAEGVVIEDAPTVQGEEGGGEGGPGEGGGACVS